MVASIGGLEAPSCTENEALQVLFDIYILDDPENLSVTPLAEHTTDVQGHEPIRRNSRRYAPKLCTAAQ